MVSPNSLPVPGMNCHMPTAPAGDLAEAVQPDSSIHSSAISSGTPPLRIRSLIQGSHLRKRLKSVIVRCLRSWQ